MSSKTTKDSGTELRVEIRGMDDGLTRSTIQIPTGQRMMLASVASAAYTDSADVQAAFIELTRAIVRQLIAEALPGVTVDRFEAVAPGAPLDARKH